ncbi:hypothetical protein DICPUDRAFT_150940 [Dictyostelium purpureum]|uniref:Uncharacterized protein n=1 Tax=Dictyostelium purpureum TaxID=5786 RepID=F0ZHM4_DICPU|nr:uncharacterized protein DICPUDRAFT_150940 [Dictyostelium purpureum]EGC36540.1 hypothetical protein DICPUDRAFT_150940 [Dictyostelium purpureum]|eukprot:XP_003286912.1 hypothetical protein DICPUDRAFT_150940 [Dictyostelium purpureum]
MHENTTNQGNNENDESEDYNLNEGTAEDEVFDGGSRGIEDSTGQDEDDSTAEDGVVDGRSFEDLASLEKIYIYLWTIKVTLVLKLAPTNNLEINGL